MRGVNLSVGDVCGSVLTVTLSDGGVLPSLRGEQSEGGSEWVREENNLDSDYQPALMQEEGNVSMATETTSQCHVKLVLVSRQTKGSRCAPACRAACASPCCYSLSANCHPLPMVGKYEVLARHSFGTTGSTGHKSELILQLNMATIVSLPGSVQQHTNKSDRDLTVLLITSLPHTEGN